MVSYLMAGALLFIAASFYLKYIPLGSRQHFDGLLRFQMKPEPENAEQVNALLGESCRRFQLVTLREISQGEQLEYAYQIKLRHCDHKDALVYLLKGMPDIAGVSLMMQETTVEL